MSNWDDSNEAAEIERLDMSFDIDLVRDRMRVLLAAVEHLSVVGDMTPARASAVAHDVEHAAHLVDDVLRLVVPRLSEALNLEILAW